MTCCRLIQRTKHRIRTASPWTARVRACEINRLWDRRPKPGRGEANMTATARRPAVTLMEVLSATGILAVAMIAILALFPIGVINMARAINQDRAATHAVNSDELMRMYWKEAWPQREPLTRVATHMICATNEDAYAN